AGREIGAIAGGDELGCRSGVIDADAHAGAAGEVAEEAGESGSRGGLAIHTDRIPRRRGVGAGYSKTGRGPQRSAHAISRAGERYGRPVLTNRRRRSSPTG